MRLERKAVLVVDDQLANIRECIEQLRYLGAEVDEYSDPSEVIKLAQAFDAGRKTLGAYDVVILDMGMPIPQPPPAGLFDFHRTGAYLLGVIRGHDQGRIPIILFSQLSEEDVIEAAWDVFVKTVTGKQYIGAPDGNRRELLSRHFNSLVWLKADYAPRIFGQAVIKLLE